ncbi:MAG: NAD(P)-dependent oxidoreductase [Deltaproteobacteria bacterium]|nr:MAG: NAD(P)-dependent oxidoreductase [Deltaproteobacteria bacterium]
MKKLLITGVSGFLGWNIAKLTRGEWHVFGTVYSHPVRIPDVNAIRMDLTNYHELKQLFGDVRPDAVVHAAAASDPNFCQLNQAASFRINVEASVNISYLCADSTIPYVFTSTDLVFDGLKPPYRETDPVGPVSVYGEHKAQAEERILTSYPKAAVCRLALMFGLSGSGRKSFIQPMITAMEKGKELSLFVDEFRTPIGVRSAAKGLLLALNEVTGVIHLGGVDRISRYDFGKLMQRIFTFENAKITPCKQNDIRMAAPRPPDVSLDSSKAFALGVKPLSVAKELQHIRAELQNVPSALENR